MADFASLTGKGVSGTIQGIQVAAGNAALMRDLGASLAMEQQAEALRQAGQTVMFVASGRPFGWPGCGCRPHPGIYPPGDSRS